MKTRLFRALSVVTAFAAAVMIFAGCKNDPKEVKLITESQAKEYVSKNLPAAAYESEKDLTDSVEYTFTDDLCGFKFTVTSSVEKKYFDATVVGYDEKTTDNWNTAYREYLKGKLADKIDALVKENSLRLTWGQGKYLLYIGCEKPYDECAAILTDLGDAFKAEDKHGKLNDCEIWCYEGDEVNYNKITEVYLFSKNGVVDKSGYEKIRGKDQSTAAGDNSK